MGNQADVKYAYGQIRENRFWLYLKEDLRQKEKSILGRMKSARNWEDFLKAQGELKSIEYTINLMEQFENVNLD